MFNTPEGEKAQAKREVEAPVSMEDIRLVIPYRITTQNQDGNDVHTWTDVVVDEIVMERHTTGIDPFTNIDYGNQEFPSEHRFDPETGLPIFNRYIAGTRRRIQWPWETAQPEAQENRPAKKRDGSNTSLIGKLASPIKSLKSITSRFGKSKKQDQQLSEPKMSGEVKKAKKGQAKLEQFDQAPKLPRAQPAKLAPDYDDDTGRNKAEVSPHTSSFYPTLVYPPFPSELTPEINQHAQEVKTAERNEKQDWYDDAKEVTPEERAERKAAKAEKLRRKSIPDSMKTPLQLRWEVERKNKLAAAEAAKVDRRALMIALGRHMAAKKEARSPASKQDTAVELD